MECVINIYVGHILNQLLPDNVCLCACVFA